MNPERLLALFDRVSEAPDAVPKLRRFVLGLAVRGKLVEQDPVDEPASELLKQIASEKARLGCPAEAPFSTPANTPFELPVGWAWTDIGRCCSKTGSGSTPRGGKDVYKSSGVPFLRSQNVYNDGLRLDDVAYIDPQTHRVMSGTKVLARDLLLNITGGSMGRCCRVPDEFGEANISQHVAIIRPAMAGLEDFLHRLVLSPYFQAFIFEEQTGAGRGGLPKNRMDRIFVALPPLAEQRRIVARVDELMALCDQLEAARADREHRRDRLATATLARLGTASPGDIQANSHFAIDVIQQLSSRRSKVNALRMSVLDLAVTGRLTTREVGDEPASALLSQIALRKPDGRHKGAATSSTGAPDAPFELPVGWEWAKLGQVASLVTSGSRDWAKHYANEGAIFVRMGNLSRGSYSLRLGNLQRVNPPRDSEGARTSLEAGDLLLSITGEVGLLGLIPPGFGEAYINQHTCLIRLPDELQTRFLPEFFRSPLALAQFNAPQRGIKNSFRLTDVTELNIPLPPLAEQHRIVARVDELMALCDQLEASLAAADTANARLLDAILHEALNGPLQAAAA